ncbi:uncharacterized protein LOC111700184 isoform X2 [Eurytemora carolleeae]|uniref:uncharacterized protein LOC111700184 isoform X2 n=1 Tax=Eurytemora carolleeae TaxID=1294199 RepID=UPI000C78E3AA|nr:uncharacterized protein LOC111700184 isoform X2 [Eurytemora carolleeae]|eukprot:XP_023326792.1 uncharacterized protein LOC111700184 isoform X2 [Eurytemora affinis]
MLLDLGGKDQVESANKREKRMNQQKKDLSMAVILISTIIMFFAFHTPRILTSVYEASTIQDVLYCRGKEKEYRGIWYLYIQLVVQLMMLVNCSINLPVYLLVSTPFRTTCRKYLLCWFTKESNDDQEMTEMIEL